MISEVLGVMKGEGGKDLGSSIVKLIIENYCLDDDGLREFLSITQLESQNQVLV